jgi:hypothetical protein
MKYHQKYKLLVDLPTGQKVGHEVVKHVNENSEMKWWFCDWDDFWKKWSYNPDFSQSSFTLEQVQNTNFFEPMGKSFNFILPFPSKEKIKEFYYLIGESRLVNSVDEVRLINPIFYSDEFYDGVYELLKKLYNEKYEL